MITYTLKSESGCSLRGAGWTIVGETKPVKDGWRKDDHLNGTRTHSPVMLEVKYRWEAPGSVKKEKPPVTANISLDTDKQTD